MFDLGVYPTMIRRFVVTSIRPQSYLSLVW